MSTSNSDMINIKKTFHHRKASKELEVFEAARYFSEYNEAAAAANGKFTQKLKKKDRGWIKGRISLDMPVKNILNLPQQHPANYSSSTVDQKPMTVIKEKKHKQPSSPGGRVASFLNSLFSHSASKKKKKKSKCSVQSMEDEEDESPSGMSSKRRISISHFRSSNAADTKFMYSSPSSGFRTPPPPHVHVQTPTKSYKELLSFSTKFNRHTKSAAAAVLDDKISHKETCCLDDKYCKLREKQKNNSERDKIWMEKYVAEEKEFRRFNETDDQLSDSSSDLFELQIYDLDYYSTGLPVYESTDIDSIKRRNSISNGPL